MMGLEPTASGATIQRSNQLSYIRHINRSTVAFLGRIIQPSEADNLPWIAN